MRDRTDVGWRACPQSYVLEVKLELGRRLSRCLFFNRMLDPHVLDLIALLYWLHNSSPDFELEKPIVQALPSHVT